MIDGFAACLNWGAETPNGRTHRGAAAGRVPLGASLSAFMRSLGVNVQGGQRGSIAPFRKQCLRIACANFKLQWSEGSRLVVSDTKIVDGLELWGTKGQGGKHRAFVQVP